MTGIRVTRLNAILASVFLIIVVIVLVTIVILRTGEKVTASADDTPDLSDHPIYSGNNFEPESDVIDVGIQPLWDHPTSLPRP